MKTPPTLKTLKKKAPRISAAEYATYTGSYLYDAEGKIVQLPNALDYHADDPGTYWAIVVIYWLEQTKETDWYNLWNGVSQSLQYKSKFVWQVQQWLTLADKFFKLIVAPTDSQQKITQAEFSLLIWALSNCSKAGCAANELTKLISGKEKRNVRLELEQAIVTRIKSITKATANINHNDENITDTAELQRKTDSSPSEIEAA